MWEDTFLDVFCATVHAYVLHLKPSIWVTQMIREFVVAVLLRLSRALDS